MRKALATFLAITTVLALATPAGAKPGGNRGKGSKVAVSIEAHLYGINQVGDLVVYFIDVTNKSSGVVTVTDSLATLEKTTVLAGESKTFVRDYTVPTLPAAGQPLINTVTAYDGNEKAVAADTVETTVYAFEPCNPSPSGEFTLPDGYSVCLWKPVNQNGEYEHGDWTIAVTPEPPGKKPISIMLNLRDHAPGNWCPLSPDGVSRWRGEPETLTFQVYLPPIPEGWHGEAICPNGGAGGDPMGVGSPGSFVLAGYGNYHVQVTPTP
jgi:hypothetical protein